MLTFGCRAHAIAKAGLAMLLVAALCGYANAQKGNAEDSLKAATDTAKKIRDATGTTNATAKRTPAGDPCTVVSLSDVRSVFPGAKSGERSRRLEKYGITECAWKGANGNVLLGVQESYSSGTVKGDAEGMAAGFIDPVQRQARGNIRYETFTTLGVQAIAFVETADPKRFILSDGAMLALRQGDHTLSLLSSELPRRDRAAAVKSLEALGKLAAKRLQ
jgi:hypothetical protein